MTWIALMILALSWNRPTSPIDELPPMYETTTVRASWYNYDLRGRIKDYWATHPTIAFHHQYKNFKHYKVCNVANGKCIVALNNDWMRSDDKYADLSQYAFNSIANLKLWVINVTIEELTY